MASDLFRREALEAKRSSWLGGISLSQPLRYRVMAASAALVALAEVLFLTLGSYTRRSTVLGQLVPTKGLALVQAPATGVISKLLVNDAVKQLKLTKVIVAHRPETIASADRILVMDGGRIIQELRPNAQVGPVVVPSQAVAA